jgi:hypothetical protein
MDSGPVLGGKAQFTSDTRMTQAVSSGLDTVDAQILAAAHVKGSILFEGNGKLSKLKNYMKTSECSGTVLKSASPCYTAGSGAIVKGKYLAN